MSHVIRQTFMSTLDDHVSDKWLDVILQDRHVGFEDIACLAAHWEIHVGRCGTSRDQVCPSSFGEILVEFVTSVRIGSVSTVVDYLSKPLSKDAQSHLHVEVVGV